MNESNEISRTSEYALLHPGYRELEVRHYSDAAMDIKLLEPDLSYASSSLEWLSQPEVGQHMGADFSNLSLEGEQQRLREIIENPDEYNWMIQLDGKVVGNVCINSIMEQSTKHGCKAGSMAILIGDRSAWGKKLARSVNAAVIDWAFAEGGFDELHIRIMDDNIASQKTFTALGFEASGNETEELQGKIVHWSHYKMTKDKWLNK